MLKWRLMLTTVPYVLAAVAVKMGLHYGLGFDGVIEFSDMSLVLTGGVFLIGFMLSGTMADYKESEKLPSELACTLETIEETFTVDLGYRRRWKRPAPSTVGYTGAPARPRSMLRSSACCWPRPRSRRSTQLPGPTGRPPN
jgi:hypothetical protein